MHRYLLVLLLVGCSTPVEPASPPTINTFEQTCENCGREWILQTKSKTAPPTVEWCFSCGDPCEEGFEILKGLASGSDLRAELIEHCMTCKGCRHAYFKPREWHELGY